MWAVSLNSLHNYWLPVHGGKIAAVLAMLMVLLLVVMEEELSEAGAVAREREERLTELEQRNKELEEDKVCMHADTHARAPGLDVLCAWVCACTRRASLRNAPRARDWSADLHATVAMSAHN